MPMRHREYRVLHRIISIQNSRNGPLSYKVSDESYYLKINANAVQRVPSSPQDYLDPKWKEWATFVEALRSSFLNRVNREQVVRDWYLLKYTDLIDDYLDKLIRLM